MKLKYLLLVIAILVIGFLAWPKAHEKLGGVYNPIVGTTSPITSYAAGTAYSLTATPAALDFGTTDPSVTITAPGTYLMFARVRTDYNAATFAAVRTATYKLRRTNNTAADVTSSSGAFATDIITAITSTAQIFNLPLVLYTTTNSNDVISLFGSIDVIPTAGSIDAVEANIVAQKLF